MSTSNCSVVAARSPRSRWGRQWKSQGQGLVEYAMILLLVAMVVIGLLTTLGGETSEVFTQVNCTMSGKEYHQDNGNGNSNKCR